MPSTTRRIQNLQMVGPVLEVIVGVDEGIEEILRKNNAPLPGPLQMDAMVDTGATGTVIQPEVIKQLGINPVSVIKISTPSSTNVSCPVYSVRLAFPGMKVLIPVMAIAAPLQGQHIQCLIGRDVLSTGVFIYTGYDNSFTLSF